VKYLSMHIGIQLNPWRWDLEWHYLIGDEWQTIINAQFICLTFSLSYMPPAKESE
jgi:hypothetical protein